MARDRSPTPALRDSGEARWIAVEADALVKVRNG
jgi:hypothetical protein